MSRKIKISRKVLREVLQDIDQSSEGFEDTVSFLQRKRKCNISERDFPDEFLAIFFGDSILGKTGAGTPLSGERALKKLLEPDAKDTILKKVGLYKTGTAMKVQKIPPEIGDILRRRIEDATESFIIGSPLFSDTICDTLSALSKAVQGLIGSISYALGLNQDFSKAQVDISQETTDAYKLVGVYYLRSPAVNGGKNPGLIESQDFVFFYETYKALSFGNPPTPENIENDMETIEQKISKLKGIPRDSSVFDQFFKEAFRNYTTKSVSDETREARQVISSADKKLSAVSNTSDIKELLVNDFIARAQRQADRLKSIINRLGDSSLKNKFNEYDYENWSK